MRPFCDFGGFMKEKLFRKDKLIAVSIFAAVVAVMYILKTPCVFERLLGVQCSSCGMTRAWLSVLRLDFVGAFEYHSLFWTVPVIALFFWVDGKLFRWNWLNYTIMIGIAALYLARWLLILFF